MANTQYRYFVFKYFCVARLEKGRDILDPKEFYYNGAWRYDDKSNRHLNDAIMDYGDYSVFDYDEVTEEEAFKKIADIDELRNIINRSASPDTNIPNSNVINNISQRAISIPTPPKIDRELARKSLDAFKEGIEALKEKYRDDEEALEEIERAVNTAIYYCNKGEFEKINSELAQLEAFLHNWY